MSQLLDIERVSVEFANGRGVLEAISDVSFSIKAGETVCLVGESGSGKTVTSKAVMRLIDDENGRISAGAIHLNGVDIAALPDQALRSLRGKKMAMVFQEPMSAFDPVFSIGRQIVETIRRHDRSRTQSEARQRAVDLLRRVGIPEPELRMKQYPNELSGGMLQRAMIAMALSCQPELLIADEPTTALDVTIQAQILQLLQELKSEFNMAILLITHDLGVAAAIADRIVVMYAGQVVEQASAADLFAEPHHPYTMGLLQSITTMDSDRSQKLFTIPGSIPSLADLPAGCRFHPRCPFATEKCLNEAPPLHDRGERQAACWHVEQFVADPMERQPAQEAEAAFHAEWSGEAASASASPDAPASPAASAGALMEPEPEQGVARASLEASGMAAALAPAPAESVADSLIELRHVTKHYPFDRSIFSWTKKAVQAVDDVSFAIRKGETFGLVGESGSGKSTLGRVLLQLEKPTSGSVIFEGRELGALTSAGLREERKHMQMIFQDPYGSVDPRWKVGDIVGEPFSVHGKLSAGEKREAVQELLQLVGLNPTAYDRFPHEFSGGQRQRIGIARAIALRPKFLLADEAVSALDVSVQAQIVNLLQDLRQRLNLTSLFIGHGLNIVRYVSDRIGVMYLGKLVEIAPSEQLFRRPAHHYTRALIASIPVPVPDRHRELSALHGEIPSPANPPSGCRFRTRCPAATARCAAEQPEMREIDRGHFVACHDPLDQVLNIEAGRRPVSADWRI
ncbi:ABC transporter ATP-binding protein [Paenibacillus rhizovicinus]|uniref:ABC transporter ATP-binding protein n=1 Tax=Paenibacillus rhizovicinus TaxID=2704463 RepID=A0A6C0P398_9BACL|nr:ABC transporter ATP-binding protein [Paenibacillus rhizovicinus]QHW32925.1 ABC transporter ATP-binding protein [Paenibacillus rhizovicinus]